jgi:hypothetical protein
MDGLMGIPAKQQSAPMRILHERLEKLRNSLEECELDVVKEHLDDVLDCFGELLKVRELLEKVWVRHFCHTINTDFGPSWAIIGICKCSSISLFILANLFALFLEEFFIGTFLKEPVLEYHFSPSPQETGIHQEALVARKMFSQMYPEAKKDLNGNEKKYRCLSMHLEELNEEVEREQAEPVIGEKADERRRTIVELAKRAMEERMLILFGISLNDKVAVNE